MDQLTEIQRKRFQVLNHIYAKTGGDELVEICVLAAELIIERKELDKILKYLEGERLIQKRADGQLYAITHWGVFQMEVALSNPEHASQYFPPVNILNIHTTLLVFGKGSH